MNIKDTKEWGKYSMLSLSLIEKRYKSHMVFSNITYTFNEGNLYILQGVNGSGKSTLLKLISGIIYKSSGQMTLGEKISFLPDKFSMPRLLKVNSYLKILFKDKNIIDKELSIFQIPNKRIGDLSKGNLQKLGILETLLFDADIYLFDEPLDGLDDYAKHLLKDRIKEKLKENKIVILSLHNKTFFNDLAPITLDMKEGSFYEKKKRMQSN